MSSEDFKDIIENDFTRRSKINIDNAKIIRQSLHGKRIRDLLAKRSYSETASSDQEGEGKNTIQ